MMSRTEAVFGVINARDANAGKDLCIISVPGDLRDEDWSGRFGKVQKEVLNAPEACLIILDLTITTWMDPLPTLSLAILLQQRYDQHQIKSHIFIGKGGRDQQTEEHRRLLKFLATQGFLKIFQQCCDFLWDHTVLDFDRMIITYCALDYPLRYRDPDCILAEMLNLEDESELESLVQRLVQQARMRALNDWLARTPALCDQTCHMLHGMLTELLLNIKEHAYTDTSKKYAGIYARIRLPKPAERDESAIWDRLRKKEDDFCPTIKYAEISPSDSWLEFFLCDLGVGLCHNLAQWPAPEDNPDAAKLLKKAAQSPAPLKELVKCLFHMAISSKNQPRSNQVTGLQQVGFLLNFQKDFIRIYSGGEWVGERMPWQRAEHNGAMRISALSRYAALDAVTSGTHYGIILRPARERLSYPDDHWIPYAPETKPNYSLSQALVSSPLEAVPATICSIDQRAAEVEPDFLKEVSLRQETESKDHNNLLINNINTILWLPASSVGKRDIFGIRDRIARTDRFEHVDRLIIADVERHVGIYLGWLMTKMKERSGKRLEVCLITRDWAVSCFVKDENKTTFYFNKEKTQDFLSGAVDEVNSVAYVFRLLRHMDSKFFWETLTNSPADEEHNVFVKEWIDWFENPKDEKFKLCGYLDFAQALTNPVRMEICQRAVLRTANALGHWRIYPADDLARSVLIRTGRLWDIAQVSGTHACDCEAIALGSVYVTGSTQRQLENRKDICLRGQMAVLRNPYSKNLIGESRNDSFHIATALDWIPKPDINSEWSPPPNELPYCRIPDTPFICRGGEDFQSLPRFEISQDGRELVSLYGQSPKDAYETWYRLGVLKLGHWVYNERHDLLTINLERAYLLDTMRHGEICKWIENTLEYYFQPAQKNGKPSDSALAQILVYPSHTVTDRIVQDMGRLYQNLLQGISIIPFKFLLGRHAVSPMRISPLTEERLRKSIALHTGSVSQKSGVVVFDDGTVTGKVFRELTLMIRSMGADKVYRMALLDRSGLPIHREMSKMFVEEHRRLWRWDVPDLGQKRSCPLCHTLDLVKDIRETNSNNQTRKRLDEWFDQWTPHSVADSWELAGWSGHVITDSEVGKQRFGIIHPTKGRSGTPVHHSSVTGTQEGDDQEKPSTPLEHNVIHLSSTSLSAMTVEIRRSTTNRAYPQRKANGPNKFSVETRLEILCTQLLLFFDEMRLPDKKSYLADILKWLWKVDDDTPISALAGLCMGLVDDRLAREMQQEIDKYLTSPLPKSLDPLLALGLLQKHTKIPPVTSSSMATTDLNKQDVALALALLFSNHKEEKSALRSLFQILGATSRDGHNSPLRTALLETVNNDDPLLQRVLMVQIYLNGLREALLHLPPIFFRLVDAVVPNTQEHAEKLQAFINEMQIFRRTLSVDPYQISETLNNIRIFLYGIDKTIGQGISSQYWKSLIMDVNTDTAIGVDFKKHVLDNVLNGAEGKISKKYRNKEHLDATTLNAWFQTEGTLRQFHLECMNDRKWEKSSVIFLPSFVLICLRDIILNGIHADAMIRNPQQSHISTVAHMWYDITIENNQVVFHFFNACKDPDFTPKLDIYFGMLERFGGKTTKPKKVDEKPLNYNGSPINDRTLVKITLTTLTLIAAIGKSI